MQSVDQNSEAAVTFIPSKRGVGLALGSGSARGLAHIGVIRALRERSIDIDCVAGTSIGALVGAVFCAGNIDRLARDFESFDWKRIATLLDPVFPRSGLIDGRSVGDFIRAYVPMRNIEDLPVPFRAVATDLLTGAEVVFETGDIIDAVRASISVPGLFTPTRCRERLLVDGGLVNPVPVSVVRAMGAGTVIAVDLCHDIVESRLAHLQPGVPPQKPGSGVARLLETLGSMHSPLALQLDAWLHKGPTPGILDVLLGSLAIMQTRISSSTLAQEHPELLILPPLGAVRFMEFDRAAEIIAIGHETAATALDRWAR